MSGETGSSGSPIGSSATPVGPPQFLSVVDSLAARASDGGIADRGGIDRGGTDRGGTDRGGTDHETDVSGVPASTPAVRTGQLIGTTGEPTDAGSGVTGALDGSAPEPDPEPEPILLLEPREGLPPVIEADESLGQAERALAAGTGPVAVDAERASGYRYGQRAYLVQLRREGAGSFLIDPIACPDLSGVGKALAGVEWVLHAASQDLPCLAEVGLVPDRLFDTE